MSIQCKDVPDTPILEFLACEPETWHTWHEGFDNSVCNAVPKGTPSKVVLAKMRRLIKRGLVDGCGCGCRGDFGITRKGLKLIKELEVR